MKLYQNACFQLGKCQVFSLSVFHVKNDRSSLDLRFSLSKASLIYLIFFPNCKMFQISPGNTSWKKKQLISSALSSSTSNSRTEDPLLYSPFGLLEEGNFNLNLIPCGQSCSGLPGEPYSNYLHVWYWFCPRCQEFASV